MKKTKRTLLCLLLAVLMVASCAITAMAASGDATVEVNGIEYTYNWSVTRHATYGNGTMATRKTPAYLTVEVRNYLYSEENDVYGYTRWIPNTGYATVASSANNLLRLGSYDVPSKVVSTSGKFYIGNNLVFKQLNVV